MPRLTVAALTLVLLALGPRISPADAEDGSGPIRRTNAEIMRQAALRERARTIRDYEIKKRPVDPSRWHPNPASPLVSRQGGPEDVLGGRPPRLLPTGPRLPQAVSTPNFTSVTFADDLALPPDTMGAVGPTNFLTHVNGRVRAHSKATGAVGALDVDADTFWAPVREDTVNGLVSDPRVRFDRLTERWFLIILDIPGDVGTTGAASSWR